MEYALVKVFSKVGVARSMALSVSARAVDDLPYVMGRLEVCRDNFGRLFGTRGPSDVAGEQSWSVRRHGDGMAGVMGIASMSEMNRYGRWGSCETSDRDNAAS